MTPVGAGPLTAAQRRAITRAAALSQLASVPRAIRRALGAGRARRAALVTGRTPPDSALTRWAYDDLASAAYEPPLLRHCVRCWYWGDLLAQLDGVDFDAELLYLACLLHDVGLSDAHRPRPVEDAHCFAVHGAGVAGRLLVAAGADQARSNVVTEAIARHMDVRGDPVRPEAYLLHAAAQLDVVGARAHDLSPAVRRAVLADHPRQGFVPGFGQQMYRESLQRPDSRAAVLWRLGLRRMLHRNPLDRETSR